MANPEWEEFNRKVIEEFRSNAGKVSGRYAGAPMILVKHTGAKTGKTYTTPLVYSKDRERYVIIASMGGAPNHPSWYHNLKARPEVTAEVGAEKFKARVSEATGAKRAQLYKEQADRMPAFWDHQKKTKRTIPVLVLERV